MTPSQQERLREIRSSLLDCNHGDGCQRDRCGHSKQSALFLLSLIATLQEEVGVLTGLLKELKYDVQDVAEAGLKGLRHPDELRLIEKRRLEREIERLRAESTNHAVRVDELTAIVALLTDALKHFEGHGLTEESRKIVTDALATPALLAAQERRRLEREFMKRYAKHDELCDTVLVPTANDPCNCGYDSALAALARLEGSDAKTSE